MTTTMQAFDVPIVLIAFKRPETTAKVLKAIREQRPSKLFIICDGPRSQEDFQGVNATRELLQQVDWPCDVKHDYASENMGLRTRIESGLDWVFSQVDRAIILEDDCVPHPTFFRFCREMLETYLHADDVAMVSGDNAHGFHPKDSSFYWSRFTLIWGWATWARAWQKYNKGQTLWPAARDSHYLNYMFRSKRVRSYWSTVFQQNYEGGNSWARVWLLSTMLRRAVCATPGVNLISNIGFGDDATHTKGSNPIRAFPDCQPMQFPLVHPASRTANNEADALIDKIVFSKDPTIFQDSNVSVSDEVRAISYHLAFRGDGLSDAATNALLATYFSDETGRFDPFHFATRDNRHKFAQTIELNSADNPYVIEQVGADLKTYLVSTRRIQSVIETKAPPQPSKPNAVESAPVSRIRGRRRNAEMMQ